MWGLTNITNTLSQTNSHTHTHTHTFCNQLVIGRHSHSVFKVTDKTGNFHQNNSNRAGETSWYGDPSDSQTCESDASVNALCLWRKKMTEMVGFGISGISKSTRGHSFWGYEKKGIWNQNINSHFQQWNGNLGMKFWRKFYWTRFKEEHKPHGQPECISQKLQTWLSLGFVI